MTSPSVEILGHLQVGPSVERLVGEAKRMLILVTPYFKPPKRLESGILAARARGVEVVLLLRGGDDRAKQEEHAAEFAARGVKVTFLPFLHAKIYASEFEAIVTSMNLYEFSTVNSFEIGVRFPGSGGSAEFKAVAAEIAVLLKQATDAEKVAAMAVRPAERRVAPADRPPPAPAARHNRKAPQGHCIRCDEAISMDVDHPFCPRCYASWARYEDVDYEEAHCHACGKEWRVSAAKPLCKACWRAS